MNILVTGAKGMVGTALVRNLENLRTGKDRTQPDLHIDQIFCYDIDSNQSDLEKYCKETDFVFNLAGVNRPKDQDEFMQGNFGFASILLDTLKKYHNRCPVMLSSSIQASLMGRFNDSEYGRSKKAGEDLFFKYSHETGAKVLVYRFPNLMGHSKPNYNSAVSTFCWAIANNKPYTVNNRSTVLELLYIDDLVHAMIDALQGKEKRCIYEKGKIIPDSEGQFCYVPNTHKITLGEIVDLLESFKRESSTLLIPLMPEGSFAKKLHSLYLTYLPVDAFKYELKMNIDERGSFTELLHLQDCGQVSINISEPGITKGNHWHNSKWEIFVVVAGHGLITERNLSTNEVVNFEVSGNKIEAVRMIPGWTHSITNLSKTDNLVTIMYCNEVFDPEKPDTYREPVK